jgi:hypothetical protein
VKGSVADAAGNSYNVGLSTEYGLMKPCSGGERIEPVRSGDENLVAKLEADNGRGLRRTGDDDEADDAVERPRTRMDNEGIRGFLSDTRSWTSEW